jgi:hypothetical protein
VFLPSAPFPLGARHTINGQNQSIEEFRSLQIENSSTVFQFPDTKRFNLSYWRMPLNLCPSPSYLLNADFHITSRTTFYPAGDLCFFVDPKGIGHLIKFVTRSARTFDIQFYVNNSNDPHYECASVCPNQTLTCSSPFDQPFFVRIGGVAATFLSLEIDYSVTYSADPQKGCFVSQIPTTLLAGEDSPILQPQNYCVTLQQQTTRLVVRLAAIATILVAVAATYQWTGYWDFSRWTQMPGDVPFADRMHGTYSVESTFEASRRPLFMGASMLGSDSGSSSPSDSLSDPLGVTEICGKR